MKKITQEELNQILQQHKLWIETDGNKGGCAVLKGTDLLGADLRHANLRAANLRAADLQGADLRAADLQGADLRFASLYGADLHYATLQSTDLRGADLRDANLYDTNLYGTDLCRAQLDVNIRDSRSFRDAKFTSDALPWLILHPEWSKLKDTVRIKVMEKEKEKVVCSVQIDPI